MSQLEIPFGIKINNPVPTDYYYGPWADLATAKANIPQAVRYDGMEVKITGLGKYWWTEDDLTDSGLKPYVSEGSSGVLRENNVYLDSTYTGAEEKGYEGKPFSTITTAKGQVVSGDRIIVKDYSGNEQLIDEGETLYYQGQDDRSTINLTAKTTITNVGLDTYLTIENGNLLGTGNGSDFIEIQNNASNKTRLDINVNEIGVNTINARSFHGRIKAKKVNATGLSNSDYRLLSSFDPFIGVPTADRLIEVHVDNHILGDLSEVKSNVNNGIIYALTNSVDGTIQYSGTYTRLHSEGEGVLNAHFSIGGSKVIFKDLIINDSLNTLFAIFFNSETDLEIQGTCIITTAATGGWSNEASQTINYSGPGLLIHNGEVIYDGSNTTGYAAYQDSIYTSISPLTLAGGATHIVTNNTNVNYTEQLPSHRDAFYISKDVSYDNLVGSFEIGETITGGTSGATGVILRDISNTLSLQNTNGVSFQDNEQITGGTSAATADVNGTETDGYITGNDGDNLDVMLFFYAVPTVASQWLEVWIDITGGTGIPTNLAKLYPDTKNFPKGTGEERGIVYSLSSAYTRNTWELNGGVIKMRSNADFDIYGLNFNFDISHKGKK